MPIDCSTGSQSWGWEELMQNRISSTEKAIRTASWVLWLNSYYPSRRNTLKIECFDIGVCVFASFKHIIEIVLWTFPNSRNMWWLTKLGSRSAFSVVPFWFSSVAKTLLIFNQSLQKLEDFRRVHFRALNLFFQKYWSCEQRTFSSWVEFLRPYLAPTMTHKL